MPSQNMPWGVVWTSWCKHLDDSYTWPQLCDSSAFLRSAFRSSPHSCPPPGRVGSVWEGRQLQLPCVWDGKDDPYLSGIPVASRMTKSRDRLMIAGAGSVQRLPQSHMPLSLLSASSSQLCMRSSFPPVMMRKTQKFDSKVSEVFIVSDHQCLAEELCSCRCESVRQGYSPVTLDGRSQSPQ